MNITDIYPSIRSDGFNPLRWDCERQGCFNRKCRPKIEVFAECLPRRIAFTDIDAISEINSKFLLLEWKKDECEIPTGQSRMFKKLLALKDVNGSNVFNILAIAGNAETMEVQAIMCPPKTKWAAADLDELKEHIRLWGNWADNYDHRHQTQQNH